MRTWQRSFFQAFTRVRILRLQPATALRLINLRRIISILRFIVAKLETQRLGRLFCFAGNLWPVLSTFQPFRGLTLTFMTEVQFLGRRKFVFFFHFSCLRMICCCCWKLLFDSQLPIYVFVLLRNMSYLTPDIQTKLFASDPQRNVVNFWSITMLI